MAHLSLSQKLSVPVHVGHCLPRRTHRTPLVFRSNQQFSLILVCFGMLQGISESDGHSGKLKRDPSFKAHAEVFRLFMAVVVNRANTSTGGNDGSSGSSSLLIPDLEDPLTLIEPLW